ncbi:hypothetical protein D915_008967 [Fasciola hepatica]|uniref:Tight junction protein ZO-1 n=1 Tax=Fasciola hepatica TaxID=6192 RepID=A0A4E0RXE2_FASHE|nr:hypothetical protein D915_008967 [Fasciola hepatica]
MHDHHNYDVVLVRPNNYDLGLGLRGARNIDGKLAVVVSEILPESPAVGKIKIISVNGDVIDNLEYGEAIEKLRSAGRIVSLQLTKCVPGRSSACVTSASMARIRSFSNGLYTNNTTENMATINPVATDQSQISLFTEEQPTNSNQEMAYRSGAPLIEDYSVDMKNDEALSNSQKNNPFKMVHLKRRDNAESLGVELVSRIFVQSVDEGGLGECSGLRSGDRLVSLNGINAAHLSLVDTANMLRRQETVIEVARKSDPDISHNEPVTDQNILETEYKRTMPNYIRRQRKHRDRYKPRPFSRPMNGVQYSSLRNLPHEILPACKQCSETYSMDEDRIFQSSTSEANLGPQINTLNHSGNQVPCEHLGDAGARGHDPLTTIPHYHSWSSLVAPRLHTCPEYQWCSANAMADRWGYSEELLDLSNDNSTSNETVTRARGQNRPRATPANNRKPTVDTRGDALIPPESVSCTRSVQFHVDPHHGTGLSLIGGNLTGVFVSGVQSDSVADYAGIREGDQIVKINGLELTDWTKEEIALALIADDGPVILELKHDPVAYVALCESHEPCDSMYVRAFFSLWPANPVSNRQASTQMNEISISEGDIFHVVDTFMDGVFGNWLASKVYPTHGSLGVIPNWQRAEEILLEEDRRKSGRTNPISLPPYERVIQISAYPLPRPVVLYGPMAALARRHLVQLSGSGSATRFELPPVNAAAAMTTATKVGATITATTGVNVENGEEATTGVIRLSAIKRCMTEKGSHCLLDLNINAVNRLILLGIPPIVVLISPASRDQLRSVLEQYWDIDKTSPALLRPRKPLRKRSEVKELTEKLWKDVMHLRHFKSHLLTDTVPLIPANEQTQKFSESDWLKNLIAVISHQQTQPVWIGEETQLAQELLEKAGKTEQCIENAASKHPEKCEADENHLTRKPTSLSNELERIHKLTSQLNLFDEQVPSGFHGCVKSIPLERNGEARFELNADIRSEKMITNGSKARQIPIQTISPGRWPPGVDVDETDISWSSDLPQPPDEVSLMSPKSTSDHKTLRGDKRPEKSGSVSWNNPITSGKTMVHKVPTDFLLDAFGICVHASMENSPLSTRRIVTIEEVADAATLTSPRSGDLSSPGYSSTSNVGRMVCTSRSSTLEKTNTLDMGSVDDPHSTVSSVPFTASKSILAECAGEFGQEGGALELPEHRIRLLIPPGALPSHPSSQRIFLRVYDSDPDKSPQIPNQSTGGSRLISPLVMCGPRGLRFRIPVELTVPRYHSDSESTSDSEVSQCCQSATKPRITLLHTSSFSTSTSADEDSSKEKVSARNKMHYAAWHEIPLVKPNEVSVSSKPILDDGIKSVIRNSTICISIDHF